MTHDELLAKINANLCGRDGCDGEHYKKDGLHGEWFALRAVVELAATYKDGNYVNEEFNQGLQTAFQLIIEAIEKELS
jgi:hypothetical protein